MKLDANKVKFQRLSKGWTQQHLADACSLNLRTIQRVEKNGVASKETTSALCSVFEIERNHITIVPKVEQNQLGKVFISNQNMSLAIAMIFGIILGALGMYFIIY